MGISLKRAYELPARTDGMRFLVDRLWPRGLAKTKAKINRLIKDVEPSNDLRKCFGRDPQKWPEFQKKYRTELKGNPALSELRKHSPQGDTNLVYAAKDELHNEAVVLKRIPERDA